MSLAKKIVQLRKEHNLTQKELASIVGVHFSHMSRYERGISLPSIEVVRKLAQMFHVSTDDLLFGDSQATGRAHIVDQELWQQFERISRMSEREKTAVKTILEAMILKHDLEERLGVRHTPTLSADETLRSDSPAPSGNKRAESELFADFEDALDGAKHPALTRRRSAPRV
ncbi:MAG: helix-turn-helix domain-containing protein [candidate division KSB1 bacterium]|nr:helix-turn-helix domain-containing protein [candidate division KSB1 bacterium]